MAVGISLVAGAGWQFFNNNGVPLAGGKLFVYNAGTTTKAVTYTSSSGSTPNTNPIILDAAGRVSEEVWLTTGASYKFALSPSTDTDPPTAAIWTKDNVPVVNDTTTALGDLASTTDNAKGDALVGFRQSNASGFLTGSVGRTLNAKMQEMVSVKDFGATGDGSTDDTAAIQAAITAAQNSIGLLFVPAGTYIVSTVTISGNLILTGAGAASLIKQKANTSDSLVRVTGTGVNVVVDNLTFDGNYTAQVSESLNTLIYSTAVGGSLTDVASLMVQNCEFRNPAYCSVRMQGDNSFTTRELLSVYNCRFIDGADSIDKPSLDYIPRDIAIDDAVEAWIENNTFDVTAPFSYGRGAIVVQQTQTAVDRYSEVNIIGNRISGRGSNVSQNIGVIDLYIWSANSTIRDNIIKNSLMSAIKWKQNASAIRVVNNTISTTSVPGKPAINGNSPTYAPANDLCLVDGNQISEWDGGTTGVIALSGVYAATADYSDGLMIVNNQLKNTSGAQIYVADTFNVGVINNQMFPLSGTIGVSAGIQNSGAVRIKDNYIGACSSYSIYIDNGAGLNINVAVTGNYITKNTGTYAVYIKASYAQVSDNQIVAFVNGVNLTSTNSALVVGNQLRDGSGTTGFFINGVTYLVISNNDALFLSSPIVYNAAVTIKRDTNNTWNWNTAVPVSGYYNVGDTVYNSAPSAGGTIGWVCTTAGTPGTWKSFGAISA